MGTQDCWPLHVNCDSNDDSYLSTRSWNRQYIAAEQPFEGVDGAGSPSKLPTQQTMATRPAPPAQLGRASIRADNLEFCLFQ